MRWEILTHSTLLLAMSLPACGRLVLLRRKSVQKSKDRNREILDKAMELIMELPEEDRKKAFQDGMKLARARAKDKALMKGRASNSNAKPTKG